ncbi:hypothetical protein H0H81_005533, partial [Sphagnurus paluster]
MDMACRTESKGKTRASRSIQHFSSAAKRTIKVAYEYLKKTISVEDPFPSTDESQDKSADVMDDPSYQLALQAWSDAAEKLDNELIDPTLEIIQHIRDRFSQYCGRIKNQTQPLVISAYGFRSLASLTQATDQSVEELLEANRNI